MIIFLSIAAALIVTGLAFMSFSASKRFMRAALYHYYMDHKEVLLEAHGDSAPLPALAFQMAAEALHNMGQNPNQSRFCFLNSSNKCSTCGI